MTLDGGLVRLRQAQSLAPSERKIADVILQDPAAFLKMNLAELAEQSGSSSAAVVRLWQSLDFEGFHDLKLRVAGDYQKEQGQSPVLYGEIEQGSDLEQIVNAVKQRSVQGIQDTASLVDLVAMGKAIDALAKGRRNCLFGVGASGIIAEDMATKLLRIGLLAMSFRDYHQCVTFATQLSPEDVFVAVSYSGYTTDTLEVAQMAKERGATLIALTQYKRNPLRELADISLFVSADESVIRAAAMTSRINSLFVMDLLFTGVASQTYETSIDLLNATGEAAARHRKN
ncbi:MAG: MurR/RpiR family transcriptional regulator [Firmicutes bacterium]|nr:MurR/RpiR family transcriptional regulator [Bacillota bacterium]